MYAIDIASKAFEGTTIVKQHRMVNQILKDEIKDMHGLQVKCATQDGMWMMMIDPIPFF